MVHNAPMNDPQPIDARRRIRELLSIPERDRTDEQWDELNELEIQTAPGNRDTGRDTGKPQDRYHERRPQGGGGQPRRPDRNNQPQKNNNGPRPEARPPQEGGAKQEARPPKRQHRRPKRPMGDKVENAGEKPANSGGEGGNGNPPA